VDTNTVSTKAIILTHTVEVHTVGSGQVRTLTYDPSVELWYWSDILERM